MMHSWRSIFFVGGFITLFLLAGFSSQSIVSAQISAITDIPITVRTHFRSTAGLNQSDSSSWPKVALIINNGTNYDGPYDYGTCLSSGNGCGTLNLYADKTQPGNCGNYFCPTAQTQTIDTQITVGKLVTQPYPESSDFMVSKLSYVFFNDYWNPNTTPVTDRDIGITKVEFFGPDNLLLETLTPASPTFGIDNSSQYGLLNGFYFDMGLVNAEGVSNDEQNGFVAAFDKQDVETIAQNQSREKGMWQLTKEGSFNIVSQTLPRNILKQLSVGSTPTPTPTAEPTSTPTPTPTPEISAASDGTLPWSSNAAQGVVGPTSAWTDMSSIGTICNGVWCWQLNFATKKLVYSGNAVNFRTEFDSAIKPGGSVTLWSNGGPRSGWEDYKNQLISLNNYQYLWLSGSGGWAEDGVGIDLTQQTYWKDTVPASDGTTIFSGKGITAAWTDKANSREYFCNGKWCWVFNYEESRWHNQDSSSRGRPFDISDLFKVAPASDGATLTSGNGPTVGWTDDVASKSVICNAGWCWSYSNQAGSRPDLLDVTWDRLNNQSLGQPISVCEAMGVSLDSCPGNEEPPVHPTADFDNSGVVDIFDYNLLLHVYGTDACSYNLAGSGCSINQQDLEVFITKFGSGG